MVYCNYGICRSASFIIAYLMLEDKLTVNEALYLLRLARPQVNPTAEYLHVLLKMEEKWGITKFRATSNETYMDYE